MKNGPIGFIDSGLGGISILKEVRKILPFEHYIYYGDSRNNPYGSKKKKELIEIVDQIVIYLLKKGCKLIVIACNTATVVTIQELRRRHPDVLFVGTEPAIKVAHDYYQKSRVLVMATSATMHSERLKFLKVKYPLQQIEFLECPNLAYLIEQGNTTKINSYLIDLLDSFRNKIDVVVLGCTHYPFVKKQIKKILGNVTFIDGGVGVAKRVKQLLTENELIASWRQVNILIENSLNEQQISRSYQLLSQEIE